MGGSGIFFLKKKIKSTQAIDHCLDWPIKGLAGRSSWSDLSFTMTRTDYELVT